VLIVVLFLVFTRLLKLSLTPDKIKTLGSELLYMPIWPLLILDPTIGVRVPFLSSLISYHRDQKYKYLL